MPWLSGFYAPNPYASGGMTATAQPAISPTGYGSVTLAIIGLKDDSIAVRRMDVKHDTV